MKSFHLDRTMMSFHGDFYPRGHLFLMFPGERQAREAESALRRGGIDGDAVTLLTPRDVLDVYHLFDGRDLALPSIGTEEQTVMHFVELAREGHHALLVPVRNDKECRHVMSLLHGAGLSCAVRYRRLVIEDLVT